ncbi:PAS domain S-box-containing protein/diguanylate cyclase (GGDEF) domain-containing protein [Formivibrio citricus]|uniref:PAS domain S-box-containing protein/diguanylate cyclase (GGDEF) domain-containing protein n=1 Tax=Formivibrio citricus TaxID=83765 RepID=A0A1I4XUJ4_9NEIS|nr:EAL domain-containing protein [Formivibrio citricus]SFN29427.1 PAS domain S-box-containing protein/diguanylate cyclase (GGDEF) domain-containing protein [Formivibrio citricus]
MQIRADGWSDDFRLKREFALHQAYFEAFDSVVATLLAPDEPDTLPQVLSILVDVSRCAAGAIYLNEPDQRAAQAIACWADPEAGLPGSIPDGLSRIAYTGFPLLAATLEAGMVLNKTLFELSPVVQMRLVPLGIRRAICLPLLEQDNCFGFLALFDVDAERERASSELRFLSMLTNVLAQALLKQRAQAGMLAGQERLKVLVGATQDMVFEIDEQGIITQAWSGLPDLPPVSVLRGASLSAVLPQELAAPMAVALPTVVREMRTQQFNCVLPVERGALYLLVRLQPIQADGQTRAVALVQDVSEVMQEAAQRKTMLDTLNLLEEAVIDLTPQGVLAETSPAWARLRGIAPQDIVVELGQPILKWVHAEDQDAVASAMGRLLDSSEAKAQRFRLLRGSGETIWVEARLIAHHAPDGGIQSIRGVLRDVTVAHLNEQHITQLALYDTLTRLPNRLLLDDELHQAIERAQRDNTKVALGFIDLDHFKEVNDAFGHKTGDELLVNVATRLSNALRPGDMLARWGGDEFIALIPDLGNLSGVRGLAEQLRSAAQQGVMLEGLEARPTISVGFAVFPDDASSAEELLSAADHTMYNAKNAGRNNVCFYSDLMHFKALGREHMAIQARLANAIHDDTLQVFYQPVVEAGTGEVLAVEALARWQDGQGGWVSPDIFIPMAEKAGMIHELSDRIVTQSLERLHRWRAAGLKQLLMVNISRSQLFSPTFLSLLVEKLLRLGLRPGDVVLEITESVALTDYARQMKHLRQIVDAGFQIAIDDFGTGYSSLSQLHEMPVQFLKVDGSFSQRLHTEDGRGIMQAIVQLGQLLKLDVIVEGVENRETAQYLNEIGVRRMQGFYFSEPVPPNVAELSLRLGVTARL